MGTGDMRRETESLRQARDDLVAQLKHRSEELERVNAALRAEITERERAEAEREHLLKRQERYANLLRKAGDRLEKRVARRTAELAEANAALEAEIAERRLAQERRRGQNDPLREPPVSRHLRRSRRTALSQRHAGAEYALRGVLR